MDNEEPKPLDIGAPIRGTFQLKQLVEWVLSTNPNNETTWIEWKVGVDLKSAEGQFDVAKQVLGFANREPARAAPYAGGCAFVVLGAEPNNLNGQASIDPSDLELGLGRYVGRPGPRWAPVWVALHGIDVLVICLEPPTVVLTQTGSSATPSLGLRHPAPLYGSEGRRFESLRAR